MAYNGSGTFERPVAPYVFDTVISETDMNTEMDGIATGLTNAVTRDGQSPALANLPMGGYLHTNVAAATGQTNYARADQVQKGTFNYLTSVGGTADAITAVAALSMSAYTTGQVFWFLPGSSNTSATPTLNVNAIGAGTITKHGGGALVAGDIRQNWPAIVKRTASGFELLNPYTVAAGQMQANSVATAAIQDSAVTTGKINDKAVTLAKMADLAANKLIGRATGSTGVPEAVGLDSTLAMDSGNLKVVAASTTQAGAVEKSTQAENEAGTSDTVFPSVLGLREALRATGTAPIFACRAWVNFNGTGTVAIRASGNVSSITDHGTGDYTVNFTTAMPDANYAIAGFCNYSPNTGANGLVSYGNDFSTAAGSVRIKTSTAPSGALQDPQYVCVAIFR